MYIPAVVREDGSPLSSHFFIISGTDLYLLIEVQKYDCKSLRNFH